MAATNHHTYIYVGLAGEGQYLAEGGLYRYAASTGEWQSMTQGLPPTPQQAARYQTPKPLHLRTTLTAGLGGAVAYTLFHCPAS